MVKLEEKHSICMVIRETVKILIKNGLTFQHKFNVEGLLGITVDDGNDVFLVSVNELVNSESNKEPSEFPKRSTRIRRKKLMPGFIMCGQRDPDALTDDEQCSDQPSSHAQSTLQDDSNTAEEKRTDAVENSQKDIEEEHDTDTWASDISIKTEPADNSRLNEEELHDASSSNDFSFSDAMLNPSGLRSVNDMFKSGLMEAVPGSSHVTLNDITSRTQVRLPPADYARLYRIIKRNDPEFRRKNAERSRKYRQNMSEEKRARNRETARIRQKRYLERIRQRESQLLKHDQSVILPNSCLDSVQGVIPQTDIELTTVGTSDPTNAEILSQPIQIEPIEFTQMVQIAPDAIGESLQWATPVKIEPQD